MRNIEVDNSELSQEIWLQGLKNQPLNPILDGLNRVSTTDFLLISVSILFSQITHLLADTCPRYSRASSPDTGDAGSGRTNWRMTGWCDLLHHVEGRMWSEQ
jgi:hypothetical protein